GGYWVYRYAQRRVKEKQEKEATECLAHARRQHHFDSNQRTCNLTVLSMLPNLRDALMTIFDTESITEKLKTSPPSKVELWEELKIKSFSRIVCVIYGCSIMALLLRVQLNVIGGYIFLDSAQSQNGKRRELSIPKDVQERYLADIKYFMGQGLEELCAFVEGAVEKELKSVPLKEKLTLNNIQARLNDVRERIETSPEISSLSSPTTVLCPYMMPKEDNSSLENLSNGEKIYQKLTQETRDLIESSDFHDVLKTCLDRGYSKLVDSFGEHYRQIATGDTIQSFHETSIPMAKLVPVASGLVHKLCSDAPNPLIQELLLLESTKTLAANIYEAFSQQEITDT
ncbi:hypothetical protein FSP39_020440, partial [Pinctada imbricata]